MPDSSKSLLAEIILHLSYDAGINKLKPSDQPIGHLILLETSETLWKRACAVQALALKGDPEQEILAELVRDLLASAETIENPVCLVGNLPTLTTEGPLWKRAIHTLSHEPDRIRDIFAPTMKRCFGR